MRSKHVVFLTTNTMPSQINGDGAYTIPLNQINLSEVLRKSL